MINYFFFGSFFRWNLQEHILKCRSLQTKTRIHINSFVVHTAYENRMQEENQELAHLLCFKAQEKPILPTIYRSRNPESEIKLIYFSNLLTED